MKTIITTALILASLGAMAATEQLTSGELFEMCRSPERASAMACRFFILGVVEGSSNSDGVEIIGGQFKRTRAPSISCAPEGTSGAKLAEAFTGSMDSLAKAYPADLELPAVSIVLASMYRAFPCR